ncbi:Glycoside hydrolase family 18 protein [Ceratobasidium theobromae]|uniref:chitinase n=1 Tax=Ceratobasidium theobromae TaxID=1582974 RepID=A0A5N5QGT0_9AGAM|nr:Glycoside hydrolase family 18 protein [Ceratobasidium theobromae]
MWAPSTVVRGVFLLVISTIASTNAIPLPRALRLPHILAKRASGTGTCRVRPRSKIAASSGGKVNVGYFTNWGVYGDKPFYPQNITTDTLTHILYAFGDCDGQTGMAKLSDTYSDQQGNFKQLYALKLKHRTVKVLLSIGGWTYSQAGHFDFVTSSSARATFVNSSIALMEDNGLDGIDIDYEYPETPEQAAGFVSLLSEMRQALDAHAKKKGETNPYQLSAAVPAGEANYKALLVSQMDSSLTRWNLMAYDYAGAWSSVSDDQANLYGPTNSGTNTNSTISWYTSNGVPASKIALGIPLYGRSFQNTNGIRQSYSGVGTGTAESGIYDYSALPPTGAQVSEDKKLVSSYSYNPATKELVSYDTPDIVKLKAQYIASQGLAGGMFWELSGDKTGSDSLVRITAQNMGALDDTPNHIYYPFSQFDNIKNNLGQGGASASPTYSAPTSTPVSTSTRSTSRTSSSPTLSAGTSSSLNPTTTSGAAPTNTITSDTSSNTFSVTVATTSPVWTPAPQPGDLCDALRVWDPAKAYSRGDVVRYLGYIWAATGDNTAQIPSGTNSPWLVIGTC